MILSSNHTLFVACIIALSTAIASAENGAPSDAFLKTYCAKCHGADKHKGDVRLDQLVLRVTGDNHELWKEVVHNIQRGDMPVGSKNSAELEVVLSTAVAVGWISNFQLKIDNVWLREPRESILILSARSACSILQSWLHQIKSPNRRNIISVR